MNRLQIPEANFQLSGEQLYGDDFTPEEIAVWYRDEQEGYASLTHDDAQAPVYLYHSLNSLHGFRNLPDHLFAEVLGVGSAFGEEFTPLRDRIGSLTILDPSDKFVRDTVHGVPVRYVKPSPSGIMPFQDNAFDLITCFGALHHIPNVTLVMAEMFRCLKPGGYALVREPIISLGDWNHPRAGLTSRERGIPKQYFLQMIIRSGFRIRKQSYCVFPPLTRVADLFGISPFSNPFITRIDQLFSLLAQWNYRYHRTTLFQKTAPMSLYFVLIKEADEQ